MARSSWTLSDPKEHPREWAAVRDELETVPPALNRWIRSGAGRDRVVIPRVMPAR